MASSIEWLDGGETWNPIRARLKNGHPFKAAVPQQKVGWACVRISPGCEHCYSEKQNEQCGTNKTRAGTGLNYTVPALQMVDLFLDEETLMKPLHWKKPRLIFPCSMTDWMADFVSDEWRDKMLAVMTRTPQHTYLTLTKRADRQRKYLSRDPEDRLDDICHQLPGSLNETWHYPAKWPLPNLWLGVSAEDQQRANERIPELLQTPAAIRWVSLEPLLEPVDLTDLPVPDSVTGHNAIYETPYRFSALTTDDDDHVYNKHPKLDWGVIGLESGAKARHGNVEWIRSLVKQFQTAGVPVFVKQLGAKPYLHKEQSVHVDKPGMKLSIQSLEIESTLNLKDPKGVDMTEWPGDLRVRQYPQMKEAAHAGA